MFYDVAPLLASVLLELELLEEDDELDEELDPPPHPPQPPPQQAYAH